MISNKTLQIEWLKTVSEKNRKMDTTLVEKVIRALLLLEGLAQSKQPFVFKGGTALMLLLGKINRLSIDIDIIIENPNEFAVQEIFESIISKLGFKRFEKNERKPNSTIQKAHYKFFYYLIHRTSQTEDYILLDILFEKPSYAKLIQLNIDSTFIIQEQEPLKVIIPSLEDILGDKLTAFAPNTTGITYEKHGQSQAMEIIKQLYDIGCLFNFVKDIGIVRTTFNIIAEIESSYRRLKINPEIVLEDIFQTALCISTRGTDGKGDFKKLSHGIKSINSYIFSESYHIERAIIDASKAAYLVILIRSGRIENRKVYKPGIVKGFDY